MKDISSACVDSGGKGYALNQEADKTLNIIRKFTRNRPEYPVNNKQENALRPCGRRPLRKPYLWIKKIDPSRRELLQELRAKRGK